MGQANMWMTVDPSSQQLVLSPYPIVENCKAAPNDSCSNYVYNSLCYTGSSSCVNGYCPTPTLTCTIDSSNNLVWQPYANSQLQPSAPMMRSNGFNEYYVVAQLSRQPAGTVMMAGPTLTMTQSTNNSNQFNVAWIGADNFIYWNQLGSQQPINPQYDCNDYKTTNPDGTFARLPNSQCRQCFNNNCCDFTTDPSNNTNIPSAQGVCNYPIPGNSTQTMNTCVGYSTSFCPTNPVNIIAVDVNTGNPVQVISKDQSSSTIWTYPLVAGGEYNYYWTINAQGQIVQAFNPTYGLGVQNAQNYAHVTLTNTNILSWTVTPQNGYVTLSTVIAPFTYYLVWQTVGANSPTTASTLYITSTPFANQQVFMFNITKATSP